MLLEQAISDALQTGNALCKFISRNEVGSTGEEIIKMDFTCQISLANVHGSTSGKKQEFQIYW